MPRGRPSTKTPEQRREALKVAINRSGLNGLELLQFLVDWYGWHHITAMTAPAGNGIEQTITRSIDSITEVRPDAL